MHSDKHLAFTDVSVSLSVTQSSLIWWKVHCLYCDEEVVIGFVVFYLRGLTGAMTLLHPRENPNF